MTATVRAPRTPSRHEVIRRGGPVSSILVLHPSLDVLAGMVMAGLWNTFAPGGVTPRAVWLPVMLAAGGLAACWAVCTFLMLRLDRAQLPGFAHGFPRAMARRLTRSGLHSALAAAVISVIALTGQFGYLTSPVACILLSTMVGAGALRLLFVARPVVALGLHRHRRVLR